MSVLQSDQLLYALGVMRMGCSKGTWDLISLRVLRRAVCIILGVAMPVVSAIGQQSALEEIVVTATKRGAVSVQDIPFAVRAVTGDVIDDYGLRSMEDIARLEPSMQYESSGTGDLQLIVRGIQSAGAATVGLYFDETVISGANFQDGGNRTPDLGAFDINRIEILKGPQGTLFGASSMSGTVRIISNKPDAGGFDANVSVMADTVESGDEGYGINGVINVPIIDDKLALRGVGWQREAGGYIDHFAGINGDTVIKDANDTEVTGGRVMLRWTPTEELTVDGYVQRQDTDVGGPQTYAEVPSGIHTPTFVAPFVPVIGGTIIPGTPSNAGTLKQDSPVQQYWDDEVQAYGGTFEYDLGFGTVLGTVSKYERETANQGDTTALAVQFGFAPPLTSVLSGHSLTQFQERDVVTSELRFSSDFDGPLNFVVGAFLSDDEIDTELNILQVDPVTGQAACASRDQCLKDPDLTVQTLDFARSQSIDYEFYALFGHVDYDITDQVAVGGGLRYFDSEQRNTEFTLQGFGLQGVIPPTQGGPIQTEPIPGIDSKVKEDDFTWDAGISYRHSDDMLYYFRGASGYRQGGINDSSLAGAIGVDIPPGFTSDTVTSLELGAKTTWFDQRLTLNAAYFKMFWDDMHVPGNTPQGGIEFIVNAGEAEVDGIELEMFAQPTEQWLLAFGVTWLDARLTSDQLLDPDISTPGPTGLDGDNIPNVADWMFSGSVEYNFPFPLINNVETALRANYSYTGESDTFFNPSFDQFTQTGDYFLLDLGAAFTYENWELTFFVRNATDERAILDFGGFTADFEQDIRTVPPRTYGLRLAWSFQ